MSKKDWKRLTVCLEPNEYQNLRIRAAAAGMSMSELVREWLLGLIHGPNPDKPEQL